MKLYYTPGACSLSPHIAAREAGIALDLVKVDLGNKKTEAGEDLHKVNPRGQVPTLVLDNGEVLTEGAAIVQYIADKAPAAGLAPAPGSMPRYRLAEWLNFVASEVHKGYSPLFSPKVPDAYKEMAKSRLAERYAYLDKEVLAKRQFLLGDQFSVADGYLFTVSRWAKSVGFDLSPYANVNAYLARIAARPKVREALQAEDLQAFDADGVYFAPQAYLASAGRVGEPVRP